MRSARETGHLTMQFLRFSIPIGILLAAAGCGGSLGSTGIGGTGGTTDPDPYAGTYQGQYFATDTGAQGTVTFKVTTAGALSGTATPIVGGQAGTPFSVSGTVSAAGNLAISGFEGSNDMGSLSTPTAATVGGYVANIAGTSTIWLTLVVNPSAPPTGGNPFAGDYSGTLVNTGNRLLNLNAWTISTSGALSGCTVIQDTGATSFGFVSGSVSSAGAISYTLTVSGEAVYTATGTLKLTGTSLTGSVTSSAGNTYTVSISQMS